MPKINAVTQTKTFSKITLALFLVVTLFATVFSPPTFATTLVENSPVEKTEDAPSNPMEEELKHANLMVNLSLFHFSHDANSLQFPLHINLTPFLLTDELVKPPSFI